MKIIAGILTSLLTFNAWGSPESDSDLSPWMIESITPIHDRVSHWVDNSSRNIDGFFGDDDSLEVENNSYLRLNQELQWQETEDLTAEPGIRFRLDMPTTKERLRLIIESDPEESQGTLAEQGSNSLRNDARDVGNTILGFARLSRKDKSRYWDTHLGAGVKIKLPLDPYARITSERLWRLKSKPWQLSSYNRASWFDSEGYSVRSRWDLGRPLDDIRHLRFITNLQWRETEDTFEFSESAELNQILGRRHAVRYAATLVGNSVTDPQINDYYLLANYRRNLHKEILYLDVIPELHFPRGSDFEPRWAFTLRLEMLFRAAINKR
ncbi:hypothetical protein [Zobellella maritima]|uniref:hypothetical protein n=1 Tax=Zobellella maritima TaxID=2059725 RepID=UPI000E2FFA33|nr:hypothetical protein [Zobellella maritima]